MKMRAMMAAAFVLAFGLETKAADAFCALDIPPGPPKKDCGCDVPGFATSGNAAFAAMALSGIVVVAIRRRRRG